MPLPGDQDLTVTWPLINPPSFLPAGKPTRGTAECCRCPPPPRPSLATGAQAEHRVHLETTSRVLKHPGACSCLLALASPTHHLGEKSKEQRAHIQWAPGAPEYPSLSFAKIVSLAYTAAIQAELLLRKMVWQLLKIFYFLCLRGMVTRSLSSCCFPSRNNQESPRVVLQQKCCVWAQN